MTFEDVYQGDGSTNLAAPPTQTSHHLQQSTQAYALFLVHSFFLLCALL